MYDFLSGKDKISDILSGKTPKQTTATTKTATPKKGFSVKVPQAMKPSGFGFKALGTAGKFAAPVAGAGLAFGTFQNMGNDYQQLSGANPFVQKWLGRTNEFLGRDMNNPAHQTAADMDARALQALYSTFVAPAESAADTVKNFFAPRADTELVADAPAPTPAPVAAPEATVDEPTITGGFDFESSDPQTRMNFLRGPGNVLMDGRKIPTQADIPAGAELVDPRAEYANTDLNMRVEDPNGGVGTVAMRGSTLNEMRGRPVAGQFAGQYMRPTTIGDPAAGGTLSSMPALSEQDRARAFAAAIRDGQFSTANLIAKTPQESMYAANEARKAKLSRAASAPISLNQSLGDVLSAKRARAVASRELNNMYTLDAQRMASEGTLAAAQARAAATLQAAQMRAAPSGKDLFAMGKTAGEMYGANPNSMDPVADFMARMQGIQAVNAATGANLPTPQVPASMVQLAQDEGFFDESLESQAEYLGIPAEQMPASPDEQAFLFFLRSQGMM